MRSQERDRQRAAALTRRGFCVVWPRSREVAGEERPTYASADGLREWLGDAVPPRTRDEQRWFTSRFGAPTSTQASGAPSATEALGGLEAAIAAVQAIDWDAEDAATLADAPVGVQRLVNRLAAAQVSCVAAVDSRGVYGLDGSVSMSAWLANRTGVEHATASRMVSAARRLSFLPQLGRHVRGW